MEAGSGLGEPKGAELDFYVVTLGRRRTYYQDQVAFVLVGPCLPEGAREEALDVHRREPNSLHWEDLDQEPVLAEIGGVEVADLDEESGCVP